VRVVSREVLLSRVAVCIRGSCRCGRDCAGARSWGNDVANSEALIPRRLVASGRRKAVDGDQ
jgi:hypothetical protein